MKLEIAYAQFGARPAVTKPIPEFLIEATEDGIRKLVSDHYDAIKTSDIAHLFPRDDEGLAKAKQHAADFLIQICGGPAYFNQTRGAPRMLGRHAPFRIDAKARETWVALFIPLLEQLHEDGVTETSIRSIWDYLNIFSIWMINTQ